jgi:hypothetical protein
MRHLLMTGLIAALLLVPVTMLAAEEASPAATFDPDHPDTLMTMNNLALTLQEQGDYAAARDLQEQVLEASSRVLGPEHPDTLRANDALAIMMEALDETEDPAESIGFQSEEE